MKFYKLLVIIVFLGVVATFVLMGRTGNDIKIVSPQGASQNSPAATLTLTPTPPPIIINQNSNLEEETEELTPQDFSPDFRLLKEEAQNL